MAPYNLGGLCLLEAAKLEGDDADAGGVRREVQCCPRGLFTSSINNKTQLYVLFIIYILFNVYGQRKVCLPGRC
jgi:hypothetical protein